MTDFKESELTLITVFFGVESTVDEDEVE